MGKMPLEINLVNANGQLLDQMIKSSQGQIQRAPKQAAADKPG
jgi:hypothetical protein